ncbi:MAG: hypothetical protein BAJALOKI2v1_340009 [Promethearchaeota archaeon]|nr:MAG: hypothetical protein BAJALOKI2v1_340009 [Candidatus Lokiarchaeota archaeon]
MLSYSEKWSREKNATSIGLNLFADNKSAITGFKDRSYVLLKEL